MRRYFTWLIVIGVALGVHSVYGNDRDLPLVTTSATGEVQALPDIAVVEGAVVEERQNADTAVAAAQEKLDDVIAMLKNREIDSKDIRAAQVTVQPRWNYPRNQPRELVGYQARADFTVKLRNLDILAVLYAGLVDTGANELQPTRFDFSERQQLELLAISRAVTLSKDKARAALQPLAAEVGAVHSVTVSTHWQEPPMMRREAQVMMSRAGAADSGPQVNVGEHTISASVNVQFLIE